VLERGFELKLPMNRGELRDQRETERRGRNRRRNEALYAHASGGRFRLPSEAISPADAEESVVRAKEWLAYFSRVEGHSAEPAEREA
jgi:hypothetical protein